MPFRTAIMNLAITAALVLVIVLGGILFRQKKVKEKAKTPPTAAKSGLNAGDVAQSATPVVADAHRFEVLKNLRLLDSQVNEADTLRVRHGERELTFVLYFIDALESRRDHPQQVTKQAKWFDVKEERVIEVGQEAAREVLKLLRQHPFEIYTKWDHVPNTTRYYALVKIQLPEGPIYLADFLVRRGYALRGDSVMVDLPAGDKRDVPTYLAYLKGLTEKAKNTRSGAWAGLE
jgi:hypothetical protein